MIDFSRIYCKTHPYQIVTNYCAKYQCLTGLCATCVCSHTHTHMSHNTIPDYQNIRTTYSDMHDRVRNQMQNLDDDKVRISALRLNIQKKKNSIRSTLIEARKQCLETVNDYFDNFTNQVNEMIQNQVNQSGYHNQNRFDDILSYLTKQMNVLIDSAHQLNSKQFLNKIKPLHKEILPHAALVHREVAYQLQENESYAPSLQMNPSVIQDIKIILKRLFLLKFDYPALKHPRNIQYRYLLNQQTNKPNDHSIQNQYKTQKSIEYQFHNRDQLVKHQPSNMTVSKIYSPNEFQPPHSGVTFNRLPTTTVTYHNPPIRANSLSKFNQSSIIRLSSNGMSPAPSILRTSNLNKSIGQMSESKLFLKNNSNINFTNPTQMKKNNNGTRLTEGGGSQINYSTSQDFRKAPSKKKLTLYGVEALSEASKQNIKL